MLSTTPRDIPLTAAHDIDLSSGSFQPFTTGLDGVAQAIDVAIRFHKGEWYRDLKKGIAYFQRPGVSAQEAILGQKHAESRAVAAYHDVIIAIEGVASVVNLAATLNPDRSLTVTWTVTVQFDDIASTTLSGTTLVPR